MNVLAEGFHTCPGTIPRRQVSLENFAKGTKEDLDKVGGGGGGGDRIQCHVALTDWNHPARKSKSSIAGLWRCCIMCLALSSCLVWGWAKIVPWVGLPGSAHHWTGM